MHTQVTHKNVWLTVAAILAVVAVFGQIDVGRRPYSGFVSPDFVQVSSVAAGGPAEAAGFQPGDRIVENHGIAPSDVSALIRRERARIGETRRFLVEREGEAAPLELHLTFAGLPLGTRIGAAALVLVAVAFLLCGLGIYLRRPGGITQLLAFLGLCAMAGFATQPYIPHTTTRLVLAALPPTALLLVTPLLIHFLLRFPDRTVPRWVPGLLYGPVALAVLLIVTTLLVQPGLLSVTNFVLPLIVVVHVLTAFVVLIRRWIKAGAETRAEQGWTTLLFAFGGGLVPALVAGFGPSLPGAQFYVLSTVLIPLGLYYVATRAGETPQQLVPQYS